MWPSIGGGEIGLVLTSWAVVAALVFFRRRAWRWAIVVSACLAASSVFTPADPLSALLIGALLLAAFTLGTRFPAPLQAT